MVYREATGELVPPSMNLGSVNPGGIPRKHRVRDLKGKFLVRGKTLERVFVLKAVSKKVVEVVVYKPSPNQLLGAPCDACPTRHRPKNLKCSRNHNAATELVDPAVLYDGSTLEPAVAKFVVLSTTVQPGARTYTATLWAESWKL